MAVILVEHDAPEPALYGAMAAVVAHHHGLDLHHLPTRHDLARHPDAAQHVVASGSLVASGLLWYERLTGRTLSPVVDVDRLVGIAAHSDVVVPLGPTVVDTEGLGARLTGHGIATRSLRVVEAGGVFTLTDVGGEPQTDYGAWTRDGYGRPVPAAEIAAAPVDCPAVRIALIGRERDQRDAYPATLAALGDAADGAGIDLDVIFLTPHGLDRAAAEQALARVDGILLPGGSDMGVVAGQIACAEVALDRALPTLGLCLGMQTLTTAAVRRAPGGAGASLAEADPTAPILTFVPIAPGATTHRLGDRILSIAPRSRLAALMARDATIRCNHRFRFDTRLEPLASASGIAVCASEAQGDIVDGVEGTGSTFFLGLQGHPELTSRPGAPHPVFSAFLSACLHGGSLPSFAGFSR